MPEIIQKFIDFLNYTSVWFRDNVISGIVIGFVKALVNLLIAVLLFIVEILRWLISLF